HCRRQCGRHDRRTATHPVSPVDRRNRPARVGRDRRIRSRSNPLRRCYPSYSYHDPRHRPDRRTTTVCRVDSTPHNHPTRNRRSLLYPYPGRNRSGDHAMTTTGQRHRKSQAEILLRFVGWEFWRNFRMLDSTFFVIILPAAMYLMFGVAMDQGEMPAGYGNVSAYVMTSMADYGAVISTTAMAGSAAVQR